MRARHWIACVGIAVAGTAPAAAAELPHPLVLGQNGRYPQVLTGQPGSATFVWTGEGGSGPDLTHVCHLVAATSCAQSTLATQAPNHPGDPQFNDEYHPRIVSVGGSVMVVSYRYPNVTTKPDGTASSNSTYLMTSTDGSATFGSFTLAGDQDPSGDATVFGPPGALRIGLISDTQTGGTFFQALTPGGYTGATANLDEGDSSRAYGGTLAAAGIGLVAAFADSGGHIYVRTFGGQGDPSDAGVWSPSPPAFAGAEPRLASGRTGVFLMARTGLISDTLAVRRLAGTIAGSATNLNSSGDVGAHELFEDPAGTLYAAWIDRSVPKVVLRTSKDGRCWGASQVLAAGGTSLDELDIAAAANGHGYATYVRNGTGSFGTGQVEAVPFAKRNGRYVRRHGHRRCVPH